MSLVPPTAHGSGSRRSVAPRRVLIVDDNADMRAVLSIALESIGVHPIHTAADAAEALRLIDTRFTRTDANPPAITLDLLIVDIMMPAMNGLEFLRLLRERFGRLPPVMIVSALDAEVHVNEALALGALEYVPKPIEIELFLYKVRALLSAADGPPFHWVAFRGTELRVGGHEAVGLAISESGVLVELAAGSGLVPGAVTPMASASFGQLGLGTRFHGHVVHVTPRDDREIVELTFVGLRQADMRRIRRFALNH